VHRLLARGIAATSLITTLLAIGSIANEASAAGPVRDCGNYGFTAGGDGPMWTYRQVSGATPAYNLTTRNVGCGTARRFALRYRGTDTYFPAWRCRESNDYEFSDVRCTASRGRVIHWQAGS
jgi:hypothetical protein